MTRGKNFTRDQVLDRAIPLFWKKGFAETSVHDLEIATGVNKSGLYSVFANKEDLYNASLTHYLEHRGATDWLMEEPLGWTNIEKYLAQGEYFHRDLRGCLMVYSIREISILSKEAREILAKYHALVRSRLLANVVSERPKGNPEQIADMIMLVFSGIALTQNLRKKKDQSTVSVQDFITLLKKL